MTSSTHDFVPERPPAELLAELDVAAQVLVRMAARGADLRLRTTGESSVVIELEEDGRRSLLSATKLLDLLACA